MHYLNFPWSDFLVIDTVDDEVEGTSEEIQQNVIEKLEENFQKADEIVPEEIRTLPKDTVDEIKVRVFSIFPIFKGHQFSVKYERKVA